MAIYRTSVASTEVEDSAAAGAALANAALALLGGLTPRLALLFATSRQDAAALLATVRAGLGPGCEVVGGLAIGIVTHEALGYDGFQAGLAVIASDAPLPVSVHAEPNLVDREFDVGAALGRKVSAAGLSPGDALLLFFDTVKMTDGAPALNMATPLLAGLASAHAIPDGLAGMGVLGDMQLHPTALFADGKVLPAAASAVHLRAPFRLDTIVMHGCRPAGRYYEVTRSDNQVVLEIDGRPALDVISEMLGPDAGLSWDDYALFLTLGVNRGDPYGPFVEENYANRMCIGVDKPRKGLVMFENDLVPGTKVQLMRRAIDASYMPGRVRELLRRAEGRTPLLAFYIDCAGRAGAYCGSDDEEALQVVETLPRSIPLLGVYSGVEIARIGGHPQALDWTGVLCLLSV